MKELPEGYSSWEEWTMSEECRNMQGQEAIELFKNGGIKAQEGETWEYEEK